MPFVRLQGRWLDQAGFAIGAQVHVEVTPGSLVLEVIEPVPESAAKCDVKRARIPDGVIERLKADVSVQRLAEARGVVFT